MSLPDPRLFPYLRVDMLDEARSEITTYEKRVELDLKRGERAFSWVAIGKRSARDDSDPLDNGKEPRHPESPTGS